MKFKCSDCGHKGDIGTISNLKSNTDFLVKQWYKDNNGFIHTLVICLKCGTFHDCKISFLKSLLKKPYKVQGILKNNVIKEKVNLAKKQNEEKTTNEHALEFMGIDNSTLNFLIEKKLYPSNFSVNYKEVDTKKTTNVFTSKSIYNELLKITTFNEYKDLVLYVVDELSRSFQENFNYDNTKKINNVLANIFAKNSDHLKLNEIEETKHYEILQLILTEYEYKDYDFQEMWSNFIKSLHYFSNIHNQTDFSNKDLSQTIFTISKMYATYLYPEKQESELLEATMLLVEWNSLLGILAANQKNFY